MDDGRPEWRRHSRRRELIELVLEFVVGVRQVGGVCDVALIGSLCTAKEHPKDADLLVTIEDDLDLTELARLGRRLQGRAQGIGHGVDVFLVSTAGEYLGRICQWKRCAPGIRISCDALNCGRREYLHDDLRTVTLSREIIDSPPLKLWPTVQHGTLPCDLLELLVRPLARTEEREGIEGAGQASRGRGSNAT